MVLIKIPKGKQNILFLFETLKQMRHNHIHIDSCVYLICDGESLTMLVRGEIVLIQVAHFKPGFFIFIIFV